MAVKYRVIDRRKPTTVGVATTLQEASTLALKYEREFDWQCEVSIETEASLRAEYDRLNGLVRGRRPLR